MNHWQRNLIAIGGCLAIIVVALFLLSYGRSHEVAPILFFGRILDAGMTAGIVGNLIIFLLITITRLNPLRIALWALLVVHGALLLVTIVVGSKVDPAFSLSGVLLGYIVSFLFWFSLHWIWSKAIGPLAVSHES